MTDDATDSVVASASHGEGDGSAAVVAVVATGESDSLLSRLRVIEDQPLASRSSAYVQLHDELRMRLEGSDQATSRG